MSKDSLQLPKTSFSMKASLPTKEPQILEKWEKNKIFKKLRKKSFGKENLPALPSAEPPPGPPPSYPPDPPEPPAKVICKFSIPTVISYIFKMVMKFTENIPACTVTFLSVLSEFLNWNEVDPF